MQFNSDFNMNKIDSYYGSAETIMVQNEQLTNKHIEQIDTANPTCV